MHSLQPITTHSNAKRGKHRRSSHPDFVKINDTLRIVQSLSLSKAIEQVDRVHSMTNVDKVEHDEVGGNTTSQT